MSETWIVVADASQARVFDPDGPNGKWVVVQQFSHLESREQGQDLRGNRPDQIQHAEEKDIRGPQPERFFDVEDDRFAKEICEALTRSVSANAFRNLVLVAPPRFLGRLRQHLTPAIRPRVRAEIAKDYSSLKPHELADSVPNF